MKNFVFIVLLLITGDCIAQFDHYFPEEKNHNIIPEEVLKQYMTIDNNDSIVVYCEIVGTGKFLSKKVEIEIDFGQEQSYFEKQWLKDKKGNKIEFNSMVDALNYMSERGWSLHSTMAITHSNSNVYHFIMQKKIRQASENP